jgi:DNA-binding beta-propeller fold protein YncE
MYALAYNPADKYLYGANGEVGQGSYLWKINPGTGAATAVGTLDATGNFDLAFRPGDNVLFMASSGSFSLYTVDPLTATATVVGAYGDALNVAGLAFAVPEPQTWALMAGGLLFMARRMASARSARRDD